MPFGSTPSRLFAHPFFVPVLIGAGLSLRLFVALAFPVEQMSDSLWYVSRALEIASGLGYQEGGHPTAYWPVGWPAILAGAYMLLGSMEAAIVVLNLAGALVCMLMVVWLGRHLAGSETVARLALLGYVLYPNHIAYSGVAATEIVYTAIAMAAFALLCRRAGALPGLILCGVLFGVATLVKPQTLAFPFGVVIMLTILKPRLAWTQALKRGLVVYLMIAAVVLPWSMRNLAVLGEFVLVSTNGGTALILGANDQATGGHFDYESTPVFRQFGVPLEDRVARQVELDALQKAQAKRWIADHPMAYLGWMPRKVLQLWIKDTDGFWSIDHSYPSAGAVIRSLQWANQIYYMLVLGMGLACLGAVLRALLTGRGAPQRIGLLFAMPIFLSLLAAVFTGQIRYHFPAMPFLIVAAAWTWVVLRARQAIQDEPTADSQVQGA